MKELNRTTKLKFNTVTSIIFQIITIVCGFIIPRLIINGYGSEVNGLVNSIKQFLQIIAFLEMGIGAVVQSSLYAPLAKGDMKAVSKIMSSGNKFFKKIGKILILYVIILLIVFPYIVNSNFDFIYTGTLLIAISISYFAQYYYGLIDTFLMNASQNSYFLYIVQISTLIINTICSVILIKLKCSIQIVKLSTSMIFLLRPIIIRSYINKRYCIDRNMELSEEPIKQKWDGVAQHISAVLVDSIDVIVLSLFSTLINVSIYSVYSNIVIGVRSLLSSATNGVQALLGDMYAKHETTKLKSFFLKYIFILNTISTIVWCITALLILSFVDLYTKKTIDVNYIFPLFAMILVSSQFIYCLRLPYNSLILAVGHYKETKKSYITAAAINIGVSIILAKRYELIGVAVGTLLSMIYQTLWMVNYCYKKIVTVDNSHFIKYILLDALIIILSFYITKDISFYHQTVISWIIEAIVKTVLVSIISLIINYVLYKCENRKRNI